MKNVIRIEHSKDYTVISNRAIRDKRLSLKARGLHHLLLSYPDSWRVSVEHLAKEASDTDGKTAIQSALSELEVLGYLTREQARDKKGRIAGWESIVRELPQAGFPCMENPAMENPAMENPAMENPAMENPAMENPAMENPAMENPAMENPPLINTDHYKVFIKEIPIPPTPQGIPQGGANREGGDFLELRNRSSLNLTDDLESFSKTDNPDPETPQFRRPPFENENHSQRQQQIACDNSDRTPQESQAREEKRDNTDRVTPAEKNIALTVPDNSHFIGHGNVAPDGSVRRFNQLSGKWMSESSDPWMANRNPLPEFKDWVYRKAIASGKQYSLANAAGEIRNNYERAGDLWEEYQGELAATAKIKSQRRAAEERRTSATEPEPPFEPSQEWLDLGVRLKKLSAEAKLKGRW